MAAPPRVAVPFWALAGAWPPATTSAEVATTAMSYLWNVFVMSLPARMAERSSFVEEHSAPLSGGAHGRDHTLRSEPYPLRLPTASTPVRKLHFPDSSLIT